MCVLSREEGSGTYFHRAVSGFLQLSLHQTDTTSTKQSSHHNNQLTTGTRFRCTTSTAQPPLPPHLSHAPFEINRKIFSVASSTTTPSASISHTLPSRSPHCRPSHATMASNNTNDAAAALRQGFFDIMGYYPELPEQRDDTSEQERASDANQNSTEATEEPPTPDPSGATAEPANLTETELPPDWFVQAFGMDENTNPFEAGAQDSSSTAQPAQEEAGTDQDDNPANSGFDVSTQAPPNLTNQSSPRFPPSTSAPFAHPPRTQAPLHPSFGQLGGATGNQPIPLAAPFGLESFGEAGEVVTAGSSTRASQPPHRNGAAPRVPLPSSPVLPVVQPANPVEMTESERRLKAAAQGRVVPPLRRVPLTPETRGKSGPKPGNRRQRVSNFDSQPGSGSSASPVVAPDQAFMNFPPVQQPTQQASQQVRPPRQKDVVDLTDSPPPTRGNVFATASARAQGSPTSLPSSSSGGSGRKRKAREPRGEANKRAKLLTGMVDSTERTTQETLAWFGRAFDTPMPADFSASGAKAIQQVPSLEEAQGIVRLESPHLRYYKLRIHPERDNTDEVEGEHLENVRKTLLACLQHPPMPAPSEHKFRETYDHNHQCQYNDLISKLANDQSHLDAAARLFLLIDAVKEVHRHGIAMPQLNATKFDTPEKIASPWLPEDARTRSCDKPIDQTITCVTRLSRIAEAIKVNKWIANDVMKGTCADDWILLICNPAQCLELKATNWESNNKKSMNEAERRRRKAAEEAQQEQEVVNLDSDD
ncbi:hypothetical protein M409DRAFT_58211 [Zasmidium cellare ATCC 36951]|uniref:Uncharacterized protein n=1 Tax=Zasmidium cellare ATCC 36951 TaxID=1080233 RepID=A0A6A6C5W3_ZASCE|nr:uncharacterized protein M409DRAFT_58211 [Zasmidium cellare ATCC 36951]KAF2162441.1 hypothetical protein M409DRAFT_58211 [Zasmidium cellare ATCC 36951]